MRFTTPPTRRESSCRYGFDATLVPPSALSLSMPGSGDVADGLTRRAATASVWQASVSATTRETPAADETRAYRPDVDARLDWESKQQSGASGALPGDAA